MKPETPELLNEATIKSYISDAHKIYLHKLVIETSLPSTNLFLLEYAKQTTNENVACLAEQQTAGRGRLGRHWISPFAENIYLSLLWHFPCSIAALSGLNILIGATIAETIKICAPALNIQLKWPNDIYLQDAKAGGVLIDVIAEADTCKAVIGIGLNLKMRRNHANEIQKPWTNLHSSQTPLSRNVLVGTLLDKLISNLHIYTEQGINSFLATWMKHDYLAGKTITIASSAQNLRGVAQGVNPDGTLRLKTTTNDIVNIATGDASVIFD